MMLIFFLIAALPILLLFLPKLIHNSKYNLPPGPKGLPFIGNIHEFDAYAPHLYFTHLANTYGTIFSLRFGLKSAVVIQSADLAKEVLKTQDTNFCTRPPLFSLRKLSYNRIDISFSPYGEYYKEIRKLCFLHLFNSKKVQSFSPIRREEVSRMIQKIADLSYASEIVNLSELLMTLTSSITCRIAFGKRYNEGVEIQQLLNEEQFMFTAFFYSDYIPFVGGWLDKLTGLSSRLEKVFNEFDRLYDQIINDHLDPNRVKGYDHAHEDIVDILLQLQNDGSFPFQLTLDNIKALSMDIVSAGTDTSAVMVVWVMTELIKNPTIMKKVQDEVRNSIQGKTFIEEEDIPKLKYLKAIIKETFRLHPAAPLLNIRESLKKCTIQGYDILPGTLLFVNVWAIGRDPESWKDPESFIPERFMDSSIDFRGNDFELIPFGAGRRMCPGMLLGVATVETTLANLLYAFDWEVPFGLKKDVMDVDVNPGITMHKKIPLRLLANKFSPTLP